MSESEEKEVMRSDIHGDMDLSGSVEENVEDTSDDQDDIESEMDEVELNNEITEIQALSPKPEVVSLLSDDEELLSPSSKNIQDQEKESLTQNEFVLKTPTVPRVLPKPIVRSPPAIAPKSAIKTGVKTVVLGSNDVLNEMTLSKALGQKIKIISMSPAQVKGNNKVVLSPTGVMNVTGSQISPGTGITNVPGSVLNTGTVVGQDTGTNLMNVSRALINTSPVYMSVAQPLTNNVIPAQSNTVVLPQASPGMIQSGIQYTQAINNSQTIHMQTLNGQPFVVQPAQYANQLGQVITQPVDDVSATHLLSNQIVPSSNTSHLTPYAANQVVLPNLSNQIAANAQVANPIVQQNQFTNQVVAGNQLTNQVIGGNPLASQIVAGTQITSHVQEPQYANQNVNYIQNSQGQLEAVQSGLSSSQRDIYQNLMQALTGQRENVINLPQLVGNRILNQQGVVQNIQSNQLVSPPGTVLVQSQQMYSPNHIVIPSSVQQTVIQTTSYVQNVQQASPILQVSSQSTLSVCTTTSYNDLSHRRAVAVVSNSSLVSPRLVSPGQNVHHENVSIRPKSQLQMSFHNYSSNSASEQLTAMASRHSTSKITETCNIPSVTPIQISEQAKPNKVLLKKPSILRKYSQLRGKKRNASYLHTSGPLKKKPSGKAENFCKIIHIDKKVGNYVPPSQLELTPNVGASTKDLEKMGLPKECVPQAACQSKASREPDLKKIDISQTTKRNQRKENLRESVRDDPGRDI